MNLDRWETIKQTVAGQFEIEDEGKYELQDERGGTKEYMIFESPLGKIKLELETRPVVLSTKTTFSKRIGQDTKVSYDVSETEKVYTLHALKWNEAQEDWNKIDADSFGGE